MQTLSRPQIRDTLILSIYRLGYIYFGGFNNLNFDIVFSLQQNTNVLGMHIWVNILGSQLKTGLFMGGF